MPRHINKFQFLRGMGKVMDLSRSYKIRAILHEPEADEDPDTEALRKDWEAIGSDLWFAIMKRANERHGQKDAR